MRTTGSPEKTAKNRPLARARVAPFFFLNHKLEKKTLGQHIANMAAAGFDGFFLHAREGLRIPYLSEAWFDAIETCLTFAEQHNLKAWLYDEMPYPSGAAGGEVVRRHPEFIEQSLHIVSQRVRGPVDLDWEIGDGEMLAAYAKANNNPRKKVVDLLPHIGPVADTWLKVTWDSRWYYPKGLAEIFSCPRTTCVLPRNVLSVKLGPGNWELVALRIMRGGDHVEPFGQYVDVSNSDATAEFLRITHEQYRARFGKKFGTLIPGIFFDEPKFRSAQPWGRGVAALLGKITPQMTFALAGENTAASSNERRRYRRAIDTAFKKNWLRPIKKWCSKNRLRLTGHISPEEDWWFESRQTGSILKSLRQLDIPGCDLIIPAVGDLRNPVLNITASLAVSAAAQTGKKYALCEVFACSGHHLPLPQLRKISTWLACHGINFLVPHGWFYSLDGYRKYDAPPNFSTPNYDTQELRQWAEEFRSLAHGPQPQADVLIMRPIDFLRGLHEKEKSLADRLLTDAAQFVTRLFLAGWSWHWIDDDELELCTTDENGIRFGKCRYQKLVYFEGFFTQETEKKFHVPPLSYFVSSSRVLSQQIRPRHPTRGEVFSRNTPKKIFFFNIGKQTARIQLCNNILQIQPGECITVSNDTSFSLTQHRALSRNDYQIGEWRAEWPQLCLYRPQNWLCGAKPAQFGSHFIDIAPHSYNAAQTVFGPVPYQDEEVLPFTKNYHTTFTSDRIIGLQICLEEGSVRGDWSAFLNGRQLKKWTRADDHRLICNVGSALRKGINNVRFEVMIRRLSHGLLEPPFLVGRFGITKGDRLTQVPSKGLFVPEKKISLSLPQFEGPLKWHCALTINTKTLGGIKLRLRRPAPDAVAVFINNKRAPSMQGAPWCVDIGHYLQQGHNKVTFHLFCPGRQKMILSRPDFVLCR